MRIRVCIGSSCHLKGSKLVINRLEELIKSTGLQEYVEFKGSFCMGNCTNGVSVSVNDEIYSVCPETTKGFFEKFILPVAKNEGGHNV
jgi:NADH:ubiquinone oxidoreductase subunit E